MHPQFTYEEVRRLDAHRTQHPGPPSVLHRPRRHLARRLRRTVRAWLRDRARDAVIDLRPLHTCVERVPSARDRRRRRRRPAEVPRAAVAPAGRS